MTPINLLTQKGAAMNATSTNFRATGMARIRRATRAGAPVTMFVRDSGRFSSQSVTFFPNGTASGFVNGVVYLKRSGLAGRKAINVNLDSINWQSVSIVS